MTPDPKKDEEVLRMVRQRLSELDIEEPEEPLPQDCCGQSCKPCVFDIHRKDLHNWARDIAKTIKFGDSTIYEHVYGADDEEKKDGDEGLKTLESYKALEILEIVQMTADTMLFTFSTKGPPISIPIGSHLRARVSTNGHHMSRQYTPTSVSATSFQVPIKLYDTGKFTKLARQWTLETTVEWLGPFLPGHGDWLKKSSFLQCYAAGTGIAPFIRIIQSLLDEDVCDLRVQLVYCVRSEEDVLFKELIDKWTKHWNFTVHVVTSSPEKPTTLPYLAQVHPGSRLKEEIFHSLLTTFCNPDHDGLRLAVCGSKSFEKDVINFARRDGLPDGQIFRFPG